MTGRAGDKTTNLPGLDWIGHMLRRPDEYMYIAKRAIEWNPQGKCGTQIGPSTPGGTHHKNARVRGETGHMVESDMNCTK